MEKTIKQKNSLFKLWDMQSQRKIAGLQLDHQRCWNWLDTDRQCTSCQEICPTHAIKLADLPKITSEKCNSCGLCSVVCPTGSISLPNLFEMRTFSKISSFFNNFETPPENLTINCDPSIYEEGKNPSNQLNICLAALEEGHWLWFFSKGVKEIHVNCGDSGECSITTGKQQLKVQIEKANLWLQTLNSQAEIFFENSILTLNEQKSAQAIINEPPLSRRDFFKRPYVRSLNPTTKNLEDQEIESDDETELETLFSPPEKQNLLLRTLPDNIENLIPPDYPEKLPLRNIHITSDCIFCDECYAHCPGGAITREDSRTTSKILFHPLQCLGCPECESLCQYNALKSKPLNAEDFPLTNRVVFSRNRAICPACERPFIPQTENDICPACVKLKSLDQDILNLIG